MACEEQKNTHESSVDFLFVTRYGVICGLLQYRSTKKMKSICFICFILFEIYLFYLTSSVRVYFNNTQLATNENAEWTRIIK